MTDQLDELDRTIDDAGARCGGTAGPVTDTRTVLATSVLITGDTSQIDAPYLSEHNSAVSVLINAFAGERSEVASLAAVRL